MHVFIFLSQVLVTWPKKLDMNCPPIYVDGYGYALETIDLQRPKPYTVPDTVFSMLQQNNALQEGTKYIKKLNPVAEKWGRSHRRGSTQSLLNMWMFLRDLYWDE